MPIRLRQASGIADASRLRQLVECIGDDFGHVLDVRVLCHCNRGVTQGALDYYILHALLVEFSCDSTAEPMPALPFQILRLQERENDSEDVAWLHRGQPSTRA